MHAIPVHDEPVRDVMLCSASVPQPPTAEIVQSKAQKSALVLPPPQRPDAEPIAQPASEETADPPPLTLSTLEQMALQNNPTIPQAASLVQQQQGLLRQAGLYPNPQAGYVRTDADQSGQTQTAGVFLGQEIVTAGKLRLASQAEQAEVQHRKLQLTAQQARVLNDVRIRFYDVLGAQRSMQVATDLVKLADEGVQVAEQLLEAKQGALPEVLQAKIQRNLVRASLEDATYRHRGAWKSLAIVVGVPDLPVTSLEGSLEDEISELDQEESLRRLLTTSPLLKSQQAEIRAAQHALSLAQAQAIPNVSFQVVAERDSVQKYSTVSSLVALPVPVFNRNQGNITNAQGVLIQQQKEYERIRLALSDQLNASFHSYLSLRAQAERLEKEVLPLAKENLDLTTKGYKAGQIDFLHVISARQSYFQANLARIDTLTELNKLVVEIEGLQLTGGLNPTEAGTALQTGPGAGSGQRGVLLQQLQEQQGGVGRNLPGAIQAGE